MNRIIRNCVYLFIFLLGIGCNQGNADVEDQHHSVEQTPVFDIAMQGVNPAWFVRATEGVDFGIHRVERFGELVADSSELISRSLAGMDRNGVQFGLLCHVAHKEAWHAAHPERFLLSFEPDLSLEDVEIRFPELNIVMMHMGRPFFDHALYMLGTYPNVYMETSVAIWVLDPDLFHRMLKESEASAGSDRVLFGTLQMAWPEVIGRSVYMIRDADYLTAEDRHAILCGNAARLLGVDETMTESMPSGFTEWLTSSNQSKINDTEYQET